MPYRSMATLLSAALEQAQLIAPPMARALALDERIGADRHWRRAQRLLQQLNDELRAERDALTAHYAPPQTPTASAARAGEQSNP